MLSRVLSRFREPAAPVEEGLEARTVRHQYGPVQLSLHIGDPNGAAWYDEEWRDVPELRFLPRFQTRPGPPSSTSAPTRACTP